MQIQKKIRTSAEVLAANDSTATTTTYTQTNKQTNRNKQTLREDIQYKLE
jgi:hypothetical protein